MKKLFLITGASGIGKTTISNEIATRIENCAIIDGDILYHMEHTNKTPAEDLEDGAKRLKLVFKNATMLINNFLENNLNVVFEYIIFPNDLKYILNHIKKNDNLIIKFIVMTGNTQTVIDRNLSREKNNLNRGLELLDIFNSFDYDRKFYIDTTNLDIQETVKMIIDDNKYIVYGGT